MNSWRDLRITANCIYTATGLEITGLYATGKMIKVQGHLSVTAESHALRYEQDSASICERQEQNVEAGARPEHPVSGASVVTARNDECTTERSAASEARRVEQNEQMLYVSGRRGGQKMDTFDKKEQAHSGIVVAEASRQHRCFLGFLRADVVLRDGIRENM